MVKKRWSTTGCPHKKKFFMVGKFLHFILSVPGGAISILHKTVCAKSYTNILIFLIPLHSRLNPKKTFKIQ